MSGSPRLERSEKGVLAAVTSSHLSQHFCVGFSVLYPDMMSDLGLSYTQLGIMDGVTSIISGFAQMLWSLLSRHAARGLLLGLGNIMMSIGIFVVSLAKGFVQLIGGSLVKGGGQAAQHPVGTSIITSKFSPQKASKALSVHYGMGYIGNIASPIILSLIAIALGWRQATGILAVVPLMAGLTLLHYLRGEESAKKSIRDTDKGRLWEDVKSVFRVRSAMLIVAGEAFAVGGTGMGVIITYTPLFLRRGLNVESIETSVVYSIAVVGGVVGTLVIGHLAQRFGNLKTALPIMGGGPLLILLLTVYDSFSLLLVVHLFVVGATSFSFSSLLQAHLASISTQRQRDIMFGLYFTIGHGLSSVWTALTGFLIDTYGSFNPAWILRAALGFVASILVLLASLQHRVKLNA